MESQGTRKNKINLEGKKKVGSLILPDIKLTTSNQNSDNGIKTDLNISGTE